MSKRLCTLVLACVFAAGGVRGIARAQAPVPPNPAHATTPWGVYHANSYAQASTAQRGPEPGDALRARHVAAGRVNGASPWTILGVPYPDGSQPVWGATLTHVLKGVLRPDGTLDRVGVERIDRNPLSVHWNLIALANGKVYVMDPGRRRILRYADASPGGPAAPIELDGEFAFPEGVRGTSAHLNVTYDGWIVVPTDEGDLFAVRPDFSEVRTGAFPVEEGDVVGHNAFPVDEAGGLYFSSQEGLTKMRWTGDGFEFVWHAPYAFRSPGCPRPRGTPQEFIWTVTGNGCSGGGTTPTLMGVGDGDRLVIAVDGHQPQNRMVAFWRDEIPDDWPGLDGYDRRVAAVTPLPYATAEGRGFNTENSPTVWGYEAAAAQWNGIDPRPDPVPGVQKLRWNPAARTLDLAWATDAVALNNVLTYSDGSGLVYGTGQRGDVFYFWGLDWGTGDVVVEHRLGTDRAFVDGGNQVVLFGDRSAAYGSGEGGLIHVTPSHAGASRSVR